MANKPRRNVIPDKRYNRFVRLRFRDGYSERDGDSAFERPEMSARDLSAKIGISTGLISKLENESITDFNNGRDGDVPPCQAATLKAYHKFFNVSYEYLMGETNMKTPEYYNMGRDPILSLFDDAFINNVKKLLGDNDYQSLNVYMIGAFLSNPEVLQQFFETLFLHLYNINKVSQNPYLSKAEKEIQTSQYWFNISYFTRGFFEFLLPALMEEFARYDSKLSKEREEYERQRADDRQAFEEYIKEHPDFDKSFWDETSEPMNSTISDVTVTVNK